MMLPLFFLILGFIALWLSSSKSIEYSLQAAELFGVSKLFVGFVLLAVSTGLPELLVAIQSSLVGQPMLAVGDIIGSNFVDISLSLGIALALLGPITVPSLTSCKKQLGMLALSSLLMLFIFGMGQLTRPIGAVLLLIYGAGIFYLWVTRKEELEPDSTQVDLLHKKLTALSRRSVLARLGSCLLLVLLSSKVCVDSALALAAYFELPLAIMGASIVAVGTSLPEISLNIQALRNNHFSLALGNSLGSIFEQGALILGLIALASPKPLPLNNLLHIAPFMFASYGILAYQLICKKTISRLTGFLLIGCYLLFLLYEIWHIYG